jgi:hypothetical protein
MPQVITLEHSTHLARLIPFKTMTSKDMNIWIYIAYEKNKQSIYLKNL